MLKHCQITALLTLRFNCNIKFERHDDALTLKLYGLVKLHGFTGHNLALDVEVIIKFVVIRGTVEGKIKGPPWSGGPRLSTRSDR